jgi:hypothetical protein
MTDQSNLYDTHQYVIPLQILARSVRRLTVRLAVCFALLVPICYQQYATISTLNVVCNFVRVATIKQANFSCCIGIFFKHKQQRCRVVINGAPESFCANRFSKHALQVWTLL